METDEIALALEAELSWFESSLERRMTSYFADAENTFEQPPSLVGSSTSYSRLVNENNLDLNERLVLCLALAPYLRPQSLDVFFTKNTNLDRRFTEFGGVAGLGHSGFLPTGETALFLLSGDNLGLRVRSLVLFHTDHVFYRQNIIGLADPEEHEPPLSGRLVLHPETAASLSPITLLR